MKQRNAVTILGVSIDLDTLNSLGPAIWAAIERCREPIVFACANPHSLVVAQSDPEFLNALNRAWPVVADGVGLTLMAKFIGIKLGPRITGTDFFFTVLRSLNRRGRGRVFFFGSTPEVLALISERFKREFPSLTLCGCLSPPIYPWPDEVNDQLIWQINETKPDVVWVGMTAPKQEKWVEANRHRLSAQIIGSIGAVFNFFAGTHPRAPVWIRACGLEWLYRFALEPRRMWRRNVISTPRFVAMILGRHFARPIDG
ncbi:WecB/TagA/CpsF family glycosyltransferase [Methylocaldum sp. GT1BB]|jgi:N-acetylglucosaminyldiphosphoundecaprenol N-acetyl-beta-D-mannosaminyltransferase|uniref:WecB/TagA/CpsF family glycosyltransferase n=1 Tax=Methylocaldum sp. GT1BB TaxID=3438963 RepID=UPI003DA02EC8